VLFIAVLFIAMPHAAIRPQSPPAFEYSQVHMGMPVRIVLHVPAEAAALRAATAAFARIAALDAAMSDYRADSEIRAVARRAPAAVPVSADVFHVVSRALEIARDTGGAFDPTVAPLVALWRDARATGRLPPRAALQAARTLTGWRRVELDAARQTIRLAEPGMRLDLGGVAKGYILQAALAVLRAEGAPAALLEAGGDIILGEAPPGQAGWRIALADIALVSNAAVATSGPAVQSVEIAGIRYSHVIDPRTGEALTTATTAHVIAPDGATADALATAATVVGPSGLAALRAKFPHAQIHLR
jgi:thiamine biosynthesis lipoprotein